MVDVERRLHCFRDSETFGRRLSRRSGISSARVGVHRFPDGESLVRVRSPVGSDALLVRSLHDPNAKLIEVALAADALRRAGAKRVTLVAPYLPYMRQDTVFRSGESVSQDVVCRWLASVFDALLTLEPHLHRVSNLAGYFPGQRSALASAPVFVDWLKGAKRPIVVVGPDEESEPWVRAIARDAGCEWMVGRKCRHGDHSVSIELPRTPRASRAVIVDDIASTGVTLAEAARALLSSGVRTVDAAVVHAIFAPGAIERIRASGVRRILSCDSIPHDTNRLKSASVFADAIAQRIQ
jgi:ribose-phosphate pyrophosphokinase